MANYSQKIENIDVKTEPDSQVIPQPNQPIEENAKIEISDIKMEIDGSTSEPTRKRTNPQHNRFDETICFNTVDRLTISFDQNRAKRKGSMAFHDRIKETNQKKFPWATSKTLNGLSEVIRRSSKIKHKCKTEKIAKLLPKFLLRKRLHKGRVFGNRSMMPF